MQLFITGNSSGLGHALTRACLGLLLLGFAGPNQAFTELVIFGDSLSDTGNVAGAPINLPPPYYNNRISNGPLAVDVLAAEFGLDAGASRHLVSNSGGDNYAIVGANAAGSDTEDLSAQISAFIARNPGRITDQALYFMMIGGNDVRDARDRSSASAATGAINNAVDSIRSSLQNLIDRGARQLFVVNVADIGKIPETIEKSAQDPGILTRAVQVSAQFNQKLKTELAKIEQGNGISIIEFDLFGALNSIIANGAANGLVFNDVACFDPDNFVFHPQCDFDKFVFFDNIHPTAATHSIIGQAMVSAVRSAAAATITGPIMLLLD